MSDNDIHIHLYIYVHINASAEKKKKRFVLMASEHLYSNINSNKNNNKIENMNELYETFRFSNEANVWNEHTELQRAQKSYSVIWGRTSTMIVLANNFSNRHTKKVGRKNLSASRTSCSQSCWCVLLYIHSILYRIERVLSASVQSAVLLYMSEQFAAAFFSRVLCGVFCVLHCENDIYEKQQQQQLRTKKIIEE